MYLRTRRRSVLLLLLGLSSALLATADPPGPHSLGVCTFFPANNVWNVPIDKLPVDANSAAYIAAIGADKPLHPDFDSLGGGIPFITVAGSQPKAPIHFTESPDESEAGPYPIPANAPIEDGGDRHVLVVDRDNCILYELYSAAPRTDGGWDAGSGAIFDLKCNAQRPKSWTSTDAAGLPIVPGLVRLEEIQSGEITHALRFTVPHTRNAFVWPARHRASSLTDPIYPPMGQRFRLKADFDISGFPSETQVLLRALKRYGIILADNGSAWYITGAPDPNWNDTDFHTLHQILGANMEAVDESSLMMSEDSAAAIQHPARAGRGAVDGASSSRAVTDQSSGGRPTADPCCTSSASVASGGRTFRFTLCPKTLPAGTASWGNQIFIDPPLAADVDFTLSSDNSALTVPALVTVPGGSGTQIFNVTTQLVTVTTAVHVTIFYAGSSASAVLTLIPPPEVQ